MSNGRRRPWIVAGVESGLDQMYAAEHEARRILRAPSLLKNLPAVQSSAINEDLGCAGHSPHRGWRTGANLYVPSSIAGSG